MHFCFSRPSRYGWQTVFVETFDWTNGTSKFLKTVLKGLLQNTQYAYYVKTQNIQNDHNTDLRSTLQGQSNILYFTTSADVPSQPFVETLHKDNQSITLGWYPFSGIRDLITYYRMHVFIEADDPVFMDQRDFCLEPRTEPHPQRAIGIELPVVNEQPSTLQSCAAEYKEWVNQHGDSVDAELQWRLHRQKICKRLAVEASSIADVPSTENRKFYCRDNSDNCLNDQTSVDTAKFGQSVHNFVMSFTPDKKIETFDGIEYSLLEPNFVIESFFDNVDYNGTIHDLMPYTMYSFRLYSCNKLGCSPYYLHFDRTESMDEADVITDISVTHDTYDSSVVHLDFTKPSDPNGLTLTYEIEKHSLDDDNKTITCITRKQHELNNGR